MHWQAMPAGFCLMFRDCATWLRLRSMQCPKQVYLLLELQLLLRRAVASRALDRC